MDKRFVNKKRSVASRIGNFILYAAIGAFLAFVLYRVLVSFTSLPAQISMVLGVLLGVAFLCFMLYHMLSIKDYEIRDDGVYFMRGDKVIDSYPFEQYEISSHVTRSYYGGIPSGTQRCLIVDNGSKRKLVTVELSQNDFEELVALVIHKQKFDVGEQNEPIAEGVASIHYDSSFSLQPGKTYATKAKLNLAAFIIVMVLSLILIFAGIALADSDGFAYMLIGLILFVISIISYLGGIFVSGSIVKGRTPSSISLTGDQLIIDGQSYPLQSISLIKLTPPSYTAHKARTLSLALDTGKRVKYNMGYYVKKGDKIFPGYDEFAEDLQTAFSDRPGVLRFEL